MSSNVILTFQAKPDRVNLLLEFLTDLQDDIIEAGALTASLMQDQSDPASVLEVDVWQSAEEHKSFIKAATAAGAFKPLESLLLSPFQVNYLDTVKYSRNRQR
jgi:quinol monooxygenase YgiN